MSDDQLHRMAIALRRLQDRVMALEAQVFDQPEGPLRLPTSAPSDSGYKRAQREKRRALLKAWQRGYSDRFLALQQSPEGRGVREHLDMLLGKGATPESALAAAEQLASDRWWEAKGMPPPTLRHFAERFEGYHVRASEAQQQQRKAREQQSAERVRRAREREQARRLEEDKPGPEEIEGLVSGFLGRGAV